MSLLGDSDEEDNNPFAGTSHLYASGIAAVPEGQDDFIPTNVTNVLSTVQEKKETRSELMNQLFGTDVIEPNGDQDFSVAATEGIEDSLFSGNDLISPTEYLKENEVIKISDAGHYRDMYGKYAIGYTIVFDGKEITRRYSEFDTLRHALCRLLPTIVIPPIPSKHPLIKYFIQPLSAEKDIKIIDRRKRLLASFLNNSYNIPEIRDHVVFKKFLDPEQVWQSVLSSPPISILPSNNLLAPPLNPTKPSPLHLLLPSPSSTANGYLEDSMNDEDKWLEAKFYEYEILLNRFDKMLQPFERHAKQTKSHLRGLANSLAELGAYYNAFSLECALVTLHKNMTYIDELSKGIEKIGQAIDVNYVSSEILSERILSLLEEPLGEMSQFMAEARQVLRFRKLKRIQYRIVDATIKKREARIQSLESAQEQMSRLEKALKENAEDSPTIAQMVNRMENPTEAAVPAETVLSSRQRQRQGSQGKWTGRLFKSRIAHGSSHLSQSPTGREIEPHLLTDDERKEEVIRLKKEVDKLHECFKLLTRDLAQVNDSTLGSLHGLFAYINNCWEVIMKRMARILLKWLKDCLQAWENARNVIEYITIES
ncbi:LAMI_0D11672g1_1 [Lachancea mirantina]|uniref:LAMI_0D11672g1_1 n=1 Tax=Lachancea mirantina TaxID=1230905 RepID=A0A1G4JF26_9SACH|nr:LAMI_0D11672g1_1 [Lachancea mirantina]